MFTYVVDQEILINHILLIMNKNFSYSLMMFLAMENNIFYNESKRNTI